MLIIKIELLNYLDLKINKQWDRQIKIKIYDICLISHICRIVFHDQEYGYTRVTQLHTCATQTRNVTDLIFKMKTEINWLIEKK